jgi:uncharacterized protein
MIIRGIKVNDCSVPMQVQICQGRIEVARGLLLRPRLDENSAMLLPHCRAVHSCGMVYAIDVLFCDASGHLLKVVERLQPWRFAACRSAAQVWELCGGNFVRQAWKLGDRICPC